MRIGLLIAGIGFLLVGLLGIAYGLPIKEFSFGNTAILTGAITACTGVLMLGLWVVVRELRSVGEQFASSVATTGRTAFPVAPPVTAAIPHGLAPENDGFASGHDHPDEVRAGEGDPVAPSSPPPWHEEAASRGRNGTEQPAEAAPAPKQRRNLLFSSTSRKERERAEGRTAETAAAGSPSPVKPSEPPPASFDDAWPQTERPRTAERTTADRPVADASARRAARTPPPAAEVNVAPERRPTPPGRSEEQPPVTVLKSGVVDGMAYSLYSDGSIEAQMPEGMMRFGSIDELRAHLDQRT